MSSITCIVYSLLTKLFYTKLHLAGWQINCKLLFFSPSGKTQAKNLNYTWSDCTYLDEEKFSYDWRKNKIKKIIIIDGE